MTTPMFKQYFEAKKHLKDEILFFRMGDFYEMFYKDAEIASKVLGIALTSRTQGENAIPMAGVPQHSLNNYLKKLITQGYKVAICDQVEDAKQAKGLVKRELTKVITPGTLMDEELLDEKKSNYLMALAVKKNTVGLCWVDVSTGELYGLDTDNTNFIDQVGKISPSECLLPESIRRDRDSELLETLQLVVPMENITSLEDWHFKGKEGKRLLKKLLQVKKLSGFGLDGKEVFIAAAGALVEYLNNTQKSTLTHIHAIHKIHSERFMHLDRATQRTLELVQTMSGGERKYSLLGTIDRTETPMGSRLLTQWVLHPLTEVKDITFRQDGVRELVENTFLRDDLKQALAKVYDLERLAAKVSTGNVNPRDMVSLRTSLGQLPSVRELLEGADSGILKQLYTSVDPLENLHQLLTEAIADHPPVQIGDGGVIRRSYHSELDELCGIAEEGQNWLEEYRKKESLRTDIPTLKIGSNNVFGYYIEVTHAHGDKVPDDYIRKQTLKNAERYITPELKEYETKVLTAEEKAIELEIQLFQEIRETISNQVGPLQKTAQALAFIDCLRGLAEVAVEKNYVAPEVTEKYRLDIEEGRHPVLESSLTEPFVPNDIHLDSEKRVMIITGPNMSGKSTYIRQIALIALMAQMGSYVPATSAQIGVVDKLFTRLGSADELYRGLSTFMVEMLETANILNNATDRSLVLLDEVGRGTSTYDGVSLAWAITEHLEGKIGCRALFATHYHELTSLSELRDGIANYSVSVDEHHDQIIFLRTIIEGPTDRSYGIHVAQLAGMPNPVINRAEEILDSLESNGSSPPTENIPAPKQVPQVMQLSLFGGLGDELSDTILGLDLTNMTPIDALMKLKELQDKLRG